jgi:hypothetical protein
LNQDSNIFPIVNVVAADGQPVDEMLFALPGESKHLGLMLEIYYEPNSSPVKYGPIAIRFGEKSIAATWDDVGRAIGFHSVLCLRGNASKLQRKGAQQVNSARLMATSEIGRIASRIINAVSNRLTGKSSKRLQWGIGLIPLTERATRVFDSHNLPINWIHPPPDRFWADPQLYLRDEKLYLFYEELIYAKNIGTLHCVEIDSKTGSPLSEHVKIEFSPPIALHLSFPNVFECDGTLWMIPECGASEKTCLYKSTVFPHQWQFDRILLENVAGVDSVVYSTDDATYLFVGDARLGNYDNHLRLFYSDSLSGVFTEHPSSPVALGLDGSRMAGNLIKQDGKLFRIAQDCSERYGGRMKVFEIVKLTKSEYEEIFVTNLDPDPNGTYPLGMHTFSLNKGMNMLAVDGLRYIKRL